MSTTHVPAESLGVPLGERATLLQLSSGFCAPCRAARGLLARVAETSDGVRHVDLDVAHHAELAGQLEITQTPTVLLLGADGSVLARHEGVPRLAAVRALLDGLTPA